MAKPTIADVKANLIISGSQDDAFITGLIDAATDYAEKFQHLEAGYYTNNTMAPATKAGVIMYASFLYESRIGGTEGFFGSSATSAQQALTTINNLLRLDRDWKV